MGLPTYLPVGVFARFIFLFIYQCVMYGIAKGFTLEPLTLRLISFGVILVNVFH